MDSEVDLCKRSCFGVENKEAVLNWKQCGEKCERKEENKL